MRTLDQVIAGLPADRRAKVIAGGKKLIAEELALRQLREARAFTQVNMATMLKTDQASISKIERRSDMMLSTMRNFIEAMGGSLHVVAQFPDGCVEVKTFGDIGDSGEPPKKSPKIRARRLEIVHAD